MSVFGPQRALDEMTEKAVKAAQQQNRAPPPAKLDSEMVLDDAKIPEDLTCSICLGIMDEPLTCNNGSAADEPCGHSFCAVSVLHLDVTFLTRQLKLHEQSCPHRLVPCEYASVGCQAKVEFCDVARHNRDSQAAHLALAMQPQWPPRAKDIAYAQYVLGFWYETGTEQLPKNAQKAKEFKAAAARNGFDEAAAREAAQKRLSEQPRIQEVIYVSSVPVCPIRIRYRSALVYRVRAPIGRRICMGLRSASKALRPTSNSS